MTTSLRIPPVLGLVTLVAGCHAPTATKPSDAAGMLARDSVSAPAQEFPAPSLLDELVLPARWAGHYRSDSLSTGERGAALPGAVVIQYVPTDTTIRPQALLALALYDSAKWQAVRAEEGPPPGDSIASRGGQVYVVGLPQSNPFPARSRDAQAFERLKLKPSELPSLLRPPT